jgi:hypothetical protein
VHVLRVQLASAGVKKAAQHGVLHVMNDRVHGCCPLAKSSLLTPSSSLPFLRLHVRHLFSPRLTLPCVSSFQKLLILSHAHSAAQALRATVDHPTSTSPKPPPLPSTICVHSHSRTHPLALHSVSTHCMSNRFALVHFCDLHRAFRAQALLVGEEAPVTPLASTFSRVGVNDLTNGNLRVVVDPTTGCLKATRVSAHLMHACRRCMALAWGRWFRWWTHKCSIGHHTAALLGNHRLLQRIASLHVDVAIMATRVGARIRCTHLWLAQFGLCFGVSDGHTQVLVQHGYVLLRVAWQPYTFTQLHQCPCQMRTTHGPITSHKAWKMPSRTHSCADGIISLTLTSVG